MDEDIQIVLEMAKESMESAISHFERELLKIRAGKANPVILDGIKIDYYGSQTPLNQVASVTAPDPRMLVVSPFEKKIIPDIERAIAEANLGLNPSNDGIVIRLPIPIPSEERRKQLVKSAKEEGENCRISLRSTRKTANDALKKLKDEGLPEDSIKRAEDKVQEYTNSFSDKVDEILKRKEAEIMTI